MILLRFTREKNPVAFFHTRRERGREGDKERGRAGKERGRAGKERVERDGEGEGGRERALAG